MSTYVVVRRRMSSGHRPMSSYVHRMLWYVLVCRRVSSNVFVFRGMFDVGRRMSSHVAVSRRISSYVVLRRRFYRRMSLYVVVFRRMLSYVVMYRRMSSYVVVCRRML